MELKKGKLNSVQTARLEILDEQLSLMLHLTFDQLLDRVNERIIEKGFESIGVKTLRNDLKAIRDYADDIPLFKATPKEPFYYYTRKFRCFTILNEEEVSYLQQASAILKKFAGLGDFGIVLGEIIKKLEKSTQSNIPEISYFQFENEAIAHGTNWMDDILSAIKGKTVIRISYQPFHHDKAAEYTFHPYLLKQYRNRWFVFGRNHKNNFISILALDRIKVLKNSATNYIENDLFEPDKYFNNLVGVSVNKDSQIETIVVKVKSSQLPYILSKPIHNNQELIKKYKNGDAKIKLNLLINYELISQLLGYGSSIEILEPQSLRNKIKDIIFTLKKSYTK